MQANISLILNILLLIAVLVVLFRMLKSRKNVLSPTLNPLSPSLGQSYELDEIIAVRKLNSDILPDEVPPPSAPPPSPLPSIAVNPVLTNDTPILKNETLMFFLLAKENRQLAGYELLQTLLATGLRFGEGQLFHRHQSSNGKGPVLCSVAAATAAGVFDLQNMGAFKAHGLCIFMTVSGEPSTDEQRFTGLVETAKQLAEALDTYLLDERRQPLTQASIQHYYRRLNLELDPHECI